MLLVSTWLPAISDVRSKEQGGAVIEVNAGPGLRMHLRPSHGSPRPVGRAIVDMMFPEMQSGAQKFRSWPSLA